MKKNVIFGFLGQTMDATSKRRGRHEKRFERWRPTISLVQHPRSLPASKLVLLYNAEETELKDIIVDDIHATSPKTVVEAHQITFDAPWDFQKVFPQLYRFIDEYPFTPEKENYYFHLTTGSNIQQASVFLCVGAKYFPGRLLQSGPNRKSSVGSKLDIIDLDDAPKAVADIFKQRRTQDTDYLKHGIDTQNDSFNQMIQRIERVAIRSKAPLLITGPTGAGKSHLASRIYQLKKLRHELSGEFVEVNCATIVGGNSAMSALFGHTKGSFTGAAAKREGLLKKADGGLLFLDEIAELGLDEQAMLLRALETKAFYPLGGDQETSSDFQLICGTNKDLRDAVTAGQFREDLFARINLFTFNLPGLAERREDIEPNLEFELERYRTSEGINIHFKPSARKRYVQFALSPSAPWRGNFRDLNASILRMATLADSALIDDTTVKEEIETLKYLWGQKPEGNPTSDLEILGQYLGPKRLSEMDLMEQHELAVVIHTCLESSSAAEAGRKLFAVSRLSRKKTNDGARVIALLNKHGLHFDQL